ncbi:hypothetical protein [Kocuria rosea]|uniref:hypothetical protein n=1 Tax=Kocuria rosea TaxID=1275 RepID=UPI002541D2DF|nr:hypothetical protein [Kocuria rosea]WIG15942.1 hypothetical protein QOY29_09465 [Kocuria rosea]
MTSLKQMRQADIEDGETPGVTRVESAEKRELKKPIRLLELENEVLRRAAAYLSQANLPEKVPAGREWAGRDGTPVAVTCRVLKFSR